MQRTQKRSSRLAASRAIEGMERESLDNGEMEQMIPLKLRKYPLQFPPIPPSPIVPTKVFSKNKQIRTRQSTHLIDWLLNLAKGYEFGQKDGPTRPESRGECARGDGILIRESAEC